MERTASTKLAIRPVDCSASSSSVLSFIRKAIHRTASPKAFFGKSSRSETSALVSNPAPTSTGAIFQASLTPPSRSQAVSASSESSAQSSACQPKDSSKPAHYATDPVYVKRVVHRWQSKSIQVLMHKLDGNRTLAHGEGNALDRTVTHVAGYLLAGLAHLIARTSSRS